MKRHQKAGFLLPRISKLTATKEKEGEKERAIRGKGGCTLSFYYSNFGYIFRPRKSVGCADFLISCRLLANLKTDSEYNTKKCIIIGKKLEEVEYDLKSYAGQGLWPLALAVNTASKVCIILQILRKANPITV